MSQTPESRNAPYRVLARKYRPLHYGDLIGQQPMVTTLTNAFRSGRIAQAYILTGVRGVGKTTTARILARALNYKRGDIDEPTIDIETEGEHCRAIMEGRHVDVIEMDAASHTGIDDIRDIIESVQYAPAIARYKVYIVDEVHMLSRNAFNGLLKTLEEPPAHLKLIFATTEIRKVPVTVLSRCQRFDLRRVDADLLVRHLGKIAEAEKVAVADDALTLIARAAEGSVRDALSIFDQAISHSSDRVEAESVRDLLGLADRARVIDLFEFVMKGDIAAALDELKSQYDIGAEPAVVLTDLAEFVHFVTRLKYIPAAGEDVALSEVERRRGNEFAEALSIRALSRAWQILLGGIEEVKRSERPLTAADMVLVRLTHAAALPTPDETLRKIHGTENAPSGDGRGPAAAATAGGGEAPAGRNIAAQPVGTHANRPVSSSAMPRAEAVTEQGVESSDTRTIEDFDALILLAEEKRDIKMRTMLRRNVRLASITDTRLEIGLTDGTPVDFVSSLGSRLTEWTGKRWTVTVNRDADAPTVEERERAEAGERADAAKSDPAVETIMRHFPGARVIDVRLREDDIPEVPDEFEEDRPEDGDLTE